LSFAAIEKQQECNENVHAASAERSDNDIHAFDTDHGLYCDVDDHDHDPDHGPNCNADHNATANCDVDVYDHDPDHELNYDCDHNPNNVDDTNRVSYYYNYYFIIIYIATCIV